MNLDFQIPLTGGVARRLAYLNSIMNVELDPRIEKHRNRDMLAKTNVIEQFVDLNIPNTPTPSEWELYQFVADTDYRAIIGAHNEEYAAILSIRSALISGRDILILNYRDSILWDPILDRMGMPYSRTLDATTSSRITLVDTAATLEMAKKHHRGHVLVHVPHRYNGISRDTNGKLRPTFDSSIDALAKEFKYCVFGFYPENQIYSGAKSNWYSSIQVSELINAINCNPRINNALSDTTNNRLALHNLGFKQCNPTSIGKLINVNVDLLNLPMFFEVIENKE